MLPPSPQSGELADGRSAGGLPYGGEEGTTSMCSISHHRLSVMHDASTMPRQSPQRSRHTSGLRVVSTSLASLAGMVTLTATPVTAAPFTNGSFESPKFATFQPLTAANAPAGWTIPSDPRGFTWNAPAMGLPRGYPDMHASDGAQFVSLQYVERLGTISQTFDTQPGQTYRVGFDLSALTQAVAGVNPSQTFTLTATAPGVSQDFSITTLGTLFGGSSKAGTDPWTHQAFDFVAAGTASTLTFVNRTLYGDPSFQFGTSLDNVTVQALSVPEPAAALLPIVGAAYLLLARRRRRSTSAVVDVQTPTA